MSCFIWNGVLSCVLGGIFCQDMFAGGRDADITFAGQAETEMWEPTYFPTHLLDSDCRIEENLKICTKIYAFSTVSGYWKLEDQDTAGSVGTGPQSQWWSRLCMPLSAMFDVSLPGCHYRQFYHNYLATDGESETNEPESRFIVIVLNICSIRKWKEAISRLKDILLNTIRVWLCKMRSLKSINPLECRGNNSAKSNSMKLVLWPLMGGLLHLV